MKRRTGIDEDAKVGLEDLTQSKRLRQMSEEERKQAKREAERVRGRYDIPRAVKEAVKVIADEYGVSASAVAGALLAYALRRYDDGEIALDKLHKEVSHSPLYDFKVESEEIVNVFRGRRDLGDKV